VYRSARELAFGAIGQNGVRVINESIVEDLHLSEAMMERVAKEEMLELERRDCLYRGWAAFSEFNGKNDYSSG
jgi:predicted phosphoribosyltransferase